MNNLRIRSQILVIGSGLAGCAAALSLADKGFEVHLLVPTDGLDGGNSAMAQGGVVFSDGFAGDAIAFNSGMEVKISLAKRQGRLVI